MPITATASRILMLPNRTFAASVLMLTLYTASALPAADDTAPAAPVPKEVRDLVGTYTGSWTLYGIDDKVGVAKKAAWTDVVKATDPRVKDGKAFVTMSDEMKFDGNKQTFKMEGTEGYLLNKDGSPGEYFIETFGQRRRMVKVSDNVWTGVTAASAVEMGQLGFPKDATGQHVLVKVVTQEGGVETHRISRVTAATWKDNDGKEHTLQFVSLHGFHKRQP
jgi:hypothetical protein